MLVWISVFLWLIICCFSLGLVANCWFCVVYDWLLRSVSLWLLVDYLCGWLRVGLFSVMLVGFAGFVDWLGFGIVVWLLILFMIIVLPLSLLWFLCCLVLCVVLRFALMCSAGWLVWMFWLVGLVWLGVDCLLFLFCGVCLGWVVFCFNSVAMRFGVGRFFICVLTALACCFIIDLSLLWLRVGWVGCCFTCWVFIWLVVLFY